MKLTLPNPPSDYDANDQVQTRRAITSALVNVVETGKDYEVGSGRVIFTDEDDGSQWQLYVASGVLGIRAL